MALLMAMIFAIAAAAAWAQTPPEYLKRVTDSYRAAFNAQDRNRDGSLTREEVRGDLLLEPRFDDIDINRDGRITPDELERFLANIPTYAR